MFVDFIICNLKRINLSLIIDMIWFHRDKTKIHAYCYTNMKMYSQIAVYTFEKLSRMILTQVFIQSLNKWKNIAIVISMNSFPLKQILYKKNCFQSILYKRLKENSSSCKLSGHEYFSLWNIYCVQTDSGEKRQDLPRRSTNKYYILQRFHIRNKFEELYC